MATTNLSAYDPQSIPELGEVRIGIVVSEWNRNVTDALLEGAYNTLQKSGIEKDNILVKYVPGSFELPLGAQILAQEKLDAIITLGCVIQGETRHFEFICQSVAQGIMQLNLTLNLPVIFGVLTTENRQQAADRSGGKHGNKGDEAAVTAMKMIQLQRSVR